MINYSSVIDFIKSGKYVDKTECFEEMLLHRYVTLENCKGTGSSLFMKTLACFLDKTIDSKNVFHNLKVVGSPCFHKTINSYWVLWLDFSDFNAMTYEEAVDYIRRKISDAYRQFYRFFESNQNGIFDYCTLEKALDIIEMKSSMDVLQTSFRLLLLQLRSYEVNGSGEKIAVLIDNMIRLESIAYDNGYSNKLNPFLESFIVEDVYKYCDFFLQIGDCVEEHDVYRISRQFLSYCNFSVFPDNVRERYKELIVEDKEQCSFDDRSIMQIYYDWDIRIQYARKMIQQAKDEEEQRQKKRIRCEKKKYSEFLSPAIPLLSPNLGIREKKLDKSSRKYEELNAWLKKVYEYCYPKFDYDKIYQYMLKINEKVSLIHRPEEFEDVLSEFLGTNTRCKDIVVNGSSGYWVQVLFDFVGERHCCMPASPHNIKVYACMKESDIARQTFVESLKYLLQNAEDSFAAKIATFSRNDQMCYWISQRDFRYLEDFYTPCYDNMDCSMPFVAFKGKLGISKEFTGMDNSHNGTQAQIISDYLRTVKCIDDIDLEDMYNNYIAKWNADIYEEERYGGFKNSSALSFIVIMDTIDILLGKSELIVDSLLMSGDERLWHVLSESRCWADVNEKFYDAKTIPILQK